MALDDIGYLIIGAEKEAGIWLRQSHDEISSIFRKFHPCFESPYDNLAIKFHMLHKDKNLPSCHHQSSHGRHGIGDILLTGLPNGLIYSRVPCDIGDKEHVAQTITNLGHAINYLMGPANDIIIMKLAYNFDTASPKYDILNLLSPQ